MWFLVFMVFWIGVILLIIFFVLAYLIFKVAEFEYKLFIVVAIGIVFLFLFGYFFALKDGDVSYFSFEAIKQVKDFYFSIVSSILGDVGFSTSNSIAIDEELQNYSS